MSKIIEVEVMKEDVLLKISNLRKSYDEHLVLKDLSLEVKQGEVVVVVGPSGCGKSTLLRCINGLEAIQQGQIELKDEVISNRSKDMHLVRQKIGMVFQSYDLFPHMTIMDNVTLGPIKAQHRPKDEVVKAAELALDRVGLLDKKDAYPRQLSGGQKQRVAIVRSLVMEPELMLFDEVTAALDPEMVREVLDVMLELAQAGSTMIIVTHEMQFARAVADRIIFMDKGEIVEENEPATFFTQPESERAKQFLNMFEFDAVKS